jgi:hypothetical protein
MRIFHIIIAPDRVRYNRPTGELLDVIQTAREIEQMLDAQNSLRWADDLRGVRDVIFHKDGFPDLRKYIHDGSFGVEFALFDKLQGRNLTAKV